MSKTKQAVNVKVGDIFEDLDRRAHGRRFRVTNIQGEKVTVENVVGKRHRTIKLARLTDRNLYREVRVDEPKQATEPNINEQ